MNNFCFLQVERMNAIWKHDLDNLLENYENDVIEIFRKVEELQPFDMASIFGCYQVLSHR